MRNNNNNNNERQNIIKDIKQLVIINIILFTFVIIISTISASNVNAQVSTGWSRVADSYLIQTFSIEGTQSAMYVGSHFKTEARLRIRYSYAADRFYFKVWNTSFEDVGITDATFVLGVNGSDVFLVKSTEGSYARQYVVHASRLKDMFTDNEVLKFHIFPTITKNAFDVYIFQVSCENFKELKN